MISKLICMLDEVVEANSNLTSHYDEFLKVLSLEEKAIIDHDINEYEKNGKSKEEVAAKILDSYQTLSSSCESICDLGAEYGYNVPPMNKLSDIISLFDEISSSGDNSEVSLKVLNLQMDKAKKSILDVLETQAQSKQYVERNVMLVNKLLQNHRQSYQFWRETIAAEAVGYNQKGVRSSNHSVSMFNAKA